jgi:cysteine desulfurase
MQQPIIYLDNNATTKIDKAVLAEIMPFLTDNFANANSTHTFGVSADEAVKTARKQVASLLKSETNEIIFTSGATEAINLAIKGVAEKYNHQGKHIITLQTEHSAVLDVCKHLETKGFEVTYLPIQSDGLIDIELLKNTLRPDTILVSAMYVNNETGIIQPIKEIAEMTHANGSLFMTDATQAVGKIPINVDDLGVDLLAMSAHKLHGPKGVGALFVRKRRKQNVKLEAILHGGGHETGFRSGTLNVPGIVGLGKACEIAERNMKADASSIERLRNSFEAGLLKIDDTFVVGNTENRLFNTTNICFKGVDSDALIMALSVSDETTPLIAVSNGSACTSASVEPSHVLTAMGLDEATAFNCIRFSLSKFTTDEELKITVAAVKRAVEKLRSFVS